uniref:Chitin-binding type-2 domain-containing protein n=1 Tax=Octopus bimaculoides TaxID=37653 RepID=A0A0L8GSV6_OCTBM
MGQNVLPYPNQTGKYIHYDWTGKVSVVCCPTNHIFDATLKTCKPSVPTLQGIALSLKPCVPNPPQYYYPHPTSLSKFIQCSQWGNSYEMSCAATVYWHPKIMTCDRMPGGNVCGVNTNGMLQPHPFSDSYFIACGAGTDYQIRKCENNKKWKQNLSKCV